jgi:CRP/FNR family transcriptional regulator, cyclic AMP receptor protein
MTTITLVRTPRMPVDAADHDGQDSGAESGANPATTAERRQRAIRESLLAEFPEPARAELLAAALPVEFPAGSMLYRDADEPRCALVISGLVRAFLSAPDGRTVTIRYVRSGDLLGIPIIVGGPIPASIQMVTNAELLVLNARTLRMLGRNDPAVGWLLAQELARRLTESYEAVADNAFGSLRERVARHLLDLAAMREDARLVADVTQQELAEAVGSTRPAVARVLGDLRQAGLIVTATRDIEVLDPEGLHAETRSRHLSTM